MLRNKLILIDWLIDLLCFVVEMDETVMFDNWVKDVEQVFCDTLSDCQRFQLVVRLISRCSWILMLELFQHMEALFKRDFICLLPDCAVYRLLSYLDAKTLLTACQVPLPDIDAWWLWPLITIAPKNKYIVFFLKCHFKLSNFCEA